MKQPTSNESKLRKPLLNDLLEYTPNHKVPFLPEVGTDIIAYPEAEASGDGNGGDKWNPWAKYSKTYDVSSDEEDDSDDDDLIGIACPFCKRQPCPR